MIHAMLEVAWQQGATSLVDGPRDSLGSRFGRALRVIRAERGIQRKELAARAGLSYAYVSEIETGKKPPSSRALVALSEALGLRPHELMAFAEDLEDRVDSGALPSPSTTWFHESPRQATAHYFRHDHIDAAVGIPEAAQAAEQDQGDPAVAELLEVVKGLSARDLKLLLDLARRFAR
jgi:transcriptional regulator with XRE-family HTH domain